MPDHKNFQKNLRPDFSAQQSAESDGNLHQVVELERKAGREKMGQIPENFCGRVLGRSKIEPQAKPVSGDGGSALHTSSPRTRFIESVVRCTGAAGDKGTLSPTVIPLTPFSYLFFPTSL